VSDETPAPEVASSAPPPPSDPNTILTAVGRRKTAVARVRLQPNGTGRIVINRKRSLEHYFEREGDRLTVLSALEAVGATKKYDVSLRLTGGGTAGQAGASRMGIARCLAKASAEWLHTLKSQGFLTRDAREKERRKYGRRGARASYQFSKR
jgi:small subunit ribosomal protein S9